MQSVSDLIDVTPQTRAFGGHSMSARLRRVLVRAPATPANANDWRRFGYPRPVNVEQSEREHAAFRALLEDEGVEAIVGGPDPAGQLDAMFAYDPSFMTDGGAILLRLGKPERLGETSIHERDYEALGISILGRIEEPGTVEGGDALWLDEQTLAVGRGYRTNDEGIDQLEAILAGIGVKVVRVALPHWRGPGECLHLMSLLSPVAADLAVAYPPLMETAFVELLRDRGWRLIEVPDEELDTLGCNVLALAPGRCLVVEGNPVTRARLEAAGCETVAYAGSEISVKRAGGPTCLTRPIWRANL